MREKGVKEDASSYLTVKHASRSHPVSDCKWEPTGLHFLAIYRTAGDIITY